MHSVPFYNCICSCTFVCFRVYKLKKRKYLNCYQMMTGSVLYVRHVVFYLELGAHALPVR